MLSHFIENYFLLAMLTLWLSDWFSCLVPGTQYIQTRHISIAFSCVQTANNLASLQELKKELVLLRQS